MDAIYKTSYEIDTMVKDSGEALYSGYNSLRYRMTRATNTYIGIAFEKNLETELYGEDEWGLSLYFNDYNAHWDIQNEYSGATNFNKIINSRVFCPQALFQIEPNNPKSNTILGQYMLESVQEYRLSKDLVGISSKNSRKDSISSGKTQYGLSSYKPADTNWFRKSYEKWIDLFAGDWLV